MAQIQEKRQDGKVITFWQWLAFGVPGGQSGLAQAFVDVKVLIHVLVGGILAWATMDNPTSELGGDLMLPFAVVLVGLCFASVGYACSLLQNPDVESIVDRDNEGIENYVFGYQFAILSTLTVAVSWGLAALGIFDCLTGVLNFAARFVLFFMASFSVNQCWGTALFALEMIRSRYVVRLAKKRKSGKTDASAEPPPDNSPATSETKTA